MQGNVLDAASYNFVQILVTVRSGSEKLVSLFINQNTVSRHVVCYLSACILKLIAEKIVPETWLLPQENTLKTDMGG